MQENTHLAFRSTCQSWFADFTEADNNVIAARSPQFTEQATRYCNFVRNLFINYDNLGYKMVGIREMWKQINIRMRISHTRSIFFYNKSIGYKSPGFCVGNR